MCLDIPHPQLWNELQTLFISNSLAATGIRRDALNVVVLACKKFTTAVMAMFRNNGHFGNGRNLGKLNEF
jgi:hypothetical protein